MCTWWAVSWSQDSWSGESQSYKQLEFQVSFSVMLDCCYQWTCHALQSRGVDARGWCAHFVQKLKHTYLHIKQPPKQHFRRPDHQLFCIVLGGGGGDTQQASMQINLHSTWARAHPWICITLVLCVFDSSFADQDHWQGSWSAPRRSILWLVLIMLVCLN